MADRQPRHGTSPTSATLSRGLIGFMIAWLAIVLVLDGVVVVQRGGSRRSSAADEPRAEAALFNPDDAGRGFQAESLTTSVGSASDAQQLETAVDRCLLDAAGLSADFLTDVTGSAARRFIAVDDPARQLLVRVVFTRDAAKARRLVQVDGGDAGRTCRQSGASGQQTAIQTGALPGVGDVAASISVDATAPDGVTHQRAELREAAVGRVIVVAVTTSRDPDSTDLAGHALAVMVTRLS